MLYFTVNETLCTRCGMCAADCPSFIIEQTGHSIPRISRKNSINCIACQHCLAVCPAGAISIFKRNPGNSLPLRTEHLPTFDQMNLLLRGRRTVRSFEDRDVAPELIKQLLVAIANAPSGVNRRQLTFSVIDNGDAMRRLRDRTLVDLVAAGKSGRIPEHFRYLLDAPGAYSEHKRDIIFRGAPHALIVSSGPESVCPSEDAIIALTYFELLANSAGLGTVWWGMFRMLIAVLPEIRNTIGIPDNHTYCYGMLFGIPAVKYARTVQRDDSAVVRTVAIP